MKIKILISISLIAICLIFSSCSALSNLPLIPDSAKDQMERQGFVVNIDENTGIQRFEVEGIVVTFYPKEMRIVIETEGTNPQPSKR